MRMRRRIEYTVIAFFGLLPLTLLAQRHSNAAGPAPVLKVSVDKQKILIGEPIQLMLEATVPGQAPFSWPNLDTLPHFEFVEKKTVDSTMKAGDRYYRQYMTITSFDSGFHAIPQLAFILGNKKYLSDSVRIEIGYTKIDPSKDFHDIKDIIDVPNPFARYYAWIVAAIALLSLALVVWLVRKKKILKIRTPWTKAPALTPYEEAIKSLKELEQEHLPEKDAVKAYYSRLSDIFRLYLLRRLNVESLAETSEELIDQLRKMGLPGEQFSVLSETLRMTDFVKFARYQPALPECEQHYQVIGKSIEALENRTKAAEAAAAEQAANKTNQTK